MQMLFTVKCAQCMSTNGPKKKMLGGQKFAFILIFYFGFETPKDTSVGRNDSSGVLTMSICSSSLRNCVKIKSVMKWRKKKDVFWPFWHRCKMAVTWSMWLFYIYMFILSRTAHWCQYLINSAFLSFFWGCQKSAQIAIHKSPAGSMTSIS